VNGVSPGGIVDGKDLEAPDLLVAAGLISRVETPSASRKILVDQKDSEGESA